MGKKIRHDTSFPEKTAGRAPRRRSSDYFTACEIRSSENQSALFPEAARRLLNELQLQQTQLEMLNEELRRNKAALEASQTRYLGFYNVAPVGYLTITRQGLIVETNLMASTLFGVSCEALTRQPLTRFIVSEDQMAFQLHLKKLFNSGESCACDLRMVNSNGGLFWGRMEATRVPDVEASNVCRVVLIDITERKQVEEELRANEEKYRVLAENIKDVIWVMDAETFVFHYISPSIYLLLGFSPEEIMASPIEAAFPFWNMDSIKNIIRQRVSDFHSGKIKSDQYFVRDFEQTRKDGTLIWAEVTVSYYMNPKTGHVEVRGVSRDITDRKQAEESLQRVAEMHSVLREIAEAALLVPTLNELYLKVHRMVARVLPARLFHINLMDEPVGEIVVAYRADELDFIPTRRPMGKGMTEYVMRIGESVQVVPVEMDRLCQLGEYTLAKTQIRQYLGAPLKDSEGKPFGAISLISTAETPTFKPNDAKVLSIIAAQVSLAIERKRAEDAIQNSQVRYRALVEQSSEALVLVDLKTREAVEVNRRFTELLGYSLPEDSPLLVHQFMEDSKTDPITIHNETLRKDGVLKTQSHLFRHKNGTEVPVERTATVIRIDRRDYVLNSLRDMTAERRRQAELVRDAELASRVQKSLLPELPESPLVAIRTLYHSSHFVSGDTYYLEWRNEGSLLRGFLIDVSGHGLATALQAASVNALLRESITSNMTLLGQMCRINARVAQYFREGAYAAMIGFELDLSTLELHYIGAGITQFYANGKKVETPGMFVGLWEHSDFIEGKISVSEGDAFHFLTDGFTDWLEGPVNYEFWASGGNDFDADVEALERLAKSGKLRDDATGICLKIMKAVDGSRISDTRGLRAADSFANTARTQ